MDISSLLKGIKPVPSMIENDQKIPEITREQIPVDSDYNLLSPHEIRILDMMGDESTWKISDFFEKFENFGKF